MNEDSKLAAVLTAIIMGTSQDGLYVEAAAGKALKIIQYFLLHPVRIEGSFDGGDYD